MGTSDNFEALKPVQSLSSTSLLAVQEGRYKKKVTVAELAAAMSASGGSVGALAMSTDSWTDGTDGTGAVTLTFTVGGAAVTAPLSGTFFIANEAVGVAAVAIGNSATASKGQISPIVADSIFYFVTNASGELDLTLDNGAADSFWIVVQKNDGSHLISSELAITGP